MVDFCHLGGQEEAHYRNEVLKWTGDSWQEVGKMKIKTAFHAASTMNTIGMSKYCK